MRLKFDATACCVGKSRIFSILRAECTAGTGEVSLPGLANVDDVDTIGAGLPQVRLHVHLEVLGTKVALGRQEHLNVLGGGVEARGEVGGSHLESVGRRRDGVISKEWLCRESWCEELRDIAPVVLVGCKFAYFWGLAPPRATWLRADLLPARRKTRGGRMLKAGPTSSIERNTTTSNAATDSRSFLPEGAGR